MAKSEILWELEENSKKMKELMDNQCFTVGDAEQFLKRYVNIYRAMEDLIVSRDNWKKKYMELKEETEEK